MRTYIAIDSNFYIGKAWNFQSPDFQQLKKLKKHGEISFLNPELVDRELRLRLSSVHVPLDKKSLARCGLVKAKKSIHKVLRDAVRQECEKCLDGYEKFHRAVNSKKVGFSKAVLADVMGDYFDGKPPFKESRKPEFPDAVLVSSLRNSLQRNERVILLSQDEAVLQCDDGNHFRVVPSLVKLFQLLDSSVPQKIWIGEQLERNWELIFDTIHDSVVQVAIDFDDDGMSTLQTCGVADVQLFDPIVVSAEQKGGELFVTIAVGAEIDVSAEVSLFQEQHSPWDSETGSYLWEEYEPAELSRSFGDTIYIHLVFLEDETMEIEEVELPFGTFELGECDKK
jgi:PIN domain-containing protein